MARHNDYKKSSERIIKQSIRILKIASVESNGSYLTRKVIQISAKLSSDKRKLNKTYEKLYFIHFTSII